MSQTTWSTKEPENKVQQVPGIQCQPPNSRGREREKKEKKRKIPPKRREKRFKKSPKKEAGASPPQQMGAVLTKGRGEIGDVIYKDNTPRQNEHSSNKQDN